MYSTINYIQRGARFLNNKLRPGQKKLSTLMLYGTDLCDSRCKHCLIWAKRPVRHLPLEKIMEIMRSKCISKNTNVGLEGGEFLLHPGADLILEWFKNNHPNFDLLSNCLKPEKVIDAVRKYKPRRLYVSLDGDKESYNHMRGKDGYASVLKVLENCREVVPISVMFTLSPFNNFDDLKHVIQVCKNYGVDIRIGVYNDISFFDTVEKAHDTGVATLAKFDQKVLKPVEFSQSLKERIPKEVMDTKENYDFLLLYDEWRNQSVKLKCNSILDSLVIHPNGDVPICQNLDRKLGNVFDSSLDEIFNSYSSQQIQKQYSNCNACWVNFHRKYDIIMMRTLEKVIPKKVVQLFLGQYQWCSQKELTYAEFMRLYSK